MLNTESLIYRLRKRAEIRRQIASRKSVQEGKPDRIADLLDEAAAALELACKAGFIQLEGVDINKNVSNDDIEDPSDEFLAKLTEFTVRTSIQDIKSGRVKILSSVFDDDELQKIDLSPKC
jgi:hypothetical protein